MNSKVKTTLMKRRDNKKIASKQSAHIFIRFKSDPSTRNQSNVNFLVDFNEVEKKFCSPWVFSLFKSF